MTKIGERMPMSHNDEGEFMGSQRQAAFVTEHVVKLPTPPETLVAENDLRQIHTWLEYSPNSINYRESTAYTAPHDWLTSNSTAIQGAIEQGVRTMSADHDLLDVESFNHLLDPTNKAKMFTAADIATAGIRDTILAKAHTNTIETAPEDIDHDAVQAIGAMMVRLHYFEEFATRHPELLDQKNLDAFQNYYSQNILALMRSTARLKSKAVTPVSGDETPRDTDGYALSA